MVVFTRGLVHYNKFFLIIIITIFILTSIPSVYAVFTVESQAENPFISTINGTLGQYYSGTVAVHNGWAMLQGQLAEYGLESAFLYLNTYNPQINTPYNLSVHFFDNSGNFSDVVLPNVQYTNAYLTTPTTYGDPSGNIEMDNIVLTSSSDLWLLTGHGPVAVNHYSLSGGTLPTTATLVSSDTFGTSYSFAHRLIQLKSGALVAVWENVVPTNNRLELYLGGAYRGLGATSWTTLTPVIFDNSDCAAPKARVGIAQHPVDASIWIFSKCDGGSTIAAVHYTEGTQGLTLDWDNTQYISNTAVNGIFNPVGPEGENPDIEAVADPYRNVIDLVYENNQYKIFDSTYFTKGAYIDVTQINADASNTYVTFPTYTERTALLSFFPRSDQMWLSYYPITNFVDCDLTVTTYKNNSWTQPIYLGIYSNSRGPGSSSYSDCVSENFVAFGQNNLNIVANLVDHNIHLLSLTSSVDPSVSPASDTFPPTNYISNPWSTNFVNDPESQVAVTSSYVTVSGVYPVTVQASDDVTVSKVEFYLDGQLMNTITSPPYIWNWDTTNLPNYSNHILMTIAYDPSGNIRFPYRRGVVVNNTATTSPTPTPSPSSTPTPTPTPPPDNTPPTVSITNPLNGSIVSKKSTISITANAIDNDYTGVTKVEFYINDTLTCTDTITSYSCYWKVPSISNKQYNLQAKAYDAARNVGSSSIVTVTAK
jgi:hypothetical protein